MSARSRKEYRISTQNQSFEMKQLLAVFLLVLMVTTRSQCIGPFHPRYETLIHCRDEARFTWPAGGPEADESMAICFKELLLTAGDTFRKERGYPALGVRPLDPLRIPFIGLDIPQLDIKGNVTDYSIRGYSKALNASTMEVRMSAKDRKGQVILKPPKRVAQWNVQGRTNFLRAFFPGATLGDRMTVRGRNVGIFGPKVITIHFLFAEKEVLRDGKAYMVLAVNSVGLSQTKSEFVKIRFVKVYDKGQSPNERKRVEALFEVMNSFADIDLIANKGVVQEVEPTVVSSMAEILFRLCSTGFDNIDLL